MVMETLEIKAHKAPFAGVQVLMSHSYFLALNIIFDMIDNPPKAGFDLSALGGLYQIKAFNLDSDVSRINIFKFFTRDLRKAENGLNISRSAVLHMEPGKETRDVKRNLLPFAAIEPADPL